MKPFRFRAAAALDLRRREEQEAAVALARVEARFSEAKETCAAVERERAKAQAEQMAQSRRGIDIAALFWHRNWITRLQATVHDLHSELQRRAQAVEEAKRLWVLARRRRMALDRMRERAMTRYRAEELRQELKQIDELARLRFTTPKVGQGETNSGD